MNQISRSYQEQLQLALQDPVEAAAYLNAAIEEQSPELLLLALRNVAAARGMQLLLDEQVFSLPVLTLLLNNLGLKLAVQTKEPQPRR